jgi:hypothetical protein
MFGVGGRFLLTPILVSIFRVPAPIAVGSAPCPTCGTSIASFSKFRRFRLGEPKIDLVMLGGSLLRVDAGTRLLASLAARGSWTVRGHAMPAATVVLDVLFVVLLSFTAAYVVRDVLRSVGGRSDVTIPGPLVTRVRIPPYVDLPRVGLRRVSVPMMSYVGFLLGLAAGLMGIGGGVLLMPVLLYGLGLTLRNAAGTGILLLVATSATGTFAQAVRGYVSLPLAMAILMGSSVGSQLGTLSTHVFPSRTLRLLFGFLLVLTVGLIVADLFGLARSGP